MTKNLRNAIKNIVVKDIDGDSTFFMKLLERQYGSSFRTSEPAVVEGRQE